jgi:antitoxin component YwqK of YwqJK toxin-antitoxin module
MALDTHHEEHDDGVKAETIRIFASHEEANLAATKLQAHGIHCWITSDDGGGVLPYLTAPGGVRLMVQASDAATAGALLGETIPAGETPALEKTEPDLPVRDSPAPQKRFAPWQMFIGIVVGVLLCLVYQQHSRPRTETYYHYTAEGKADEAWVYRDGHLEEIMKDRNRDGAWDDWTYYENGKIVRLQRDNNFDGVPDETWTYSNGTVVTKEKDTDFNGLPDEFCTYKDELIQQVEIRPNGAKFATQRELYKNGVLVEILRGGDGKGNFTEEVRYDPFFEAISTNKVR